MGLNSNIDNADEHKMVIPMLIVIGIHLVTFIAAIAVGVLSLMKGQGQYATFNGWACIVSGIVVLVGGWALTGQIQSALSGGIEPWWSINRVLPAKLRR